MAKKVVLASLLSIPICLICLIAFVWFAVKYRLPIFTSNYVTQSLPNPNGRLKAVQFSRGTALDGPPDYVNISVLPSFVSLPNESGNVFSSLVDSIDGGLPSEVGMRWLDDRRLQITYDEKQARIEKKQSAAQVFSGFSFETVDILYAPR